MPEFEFSLRDTQDMIAQWVDVIDGVIPQSLEFAMSKVVEESEEIQEAIENGKSKEEVAGELADIVFVAFSIGNILGIDMQEAMEKCLDKNWRRINRPKIDELRRQGFEGMDLSNEGKRTI